MFAGAFWIRAGRGRPSGARTDSIPCDSVRAVNLVIDSVANARYFKSQVLRFAHEGGRIRVVTKPVSSLSTLDGMTVAYLDERCRITSLVLTDSA
jgi:hypothetical protein